MLRAHVTAREDLERGEKLLAEIILAAADAGERRRPTDHRAVADLIAVVRFHAPDRDDKVTVDAISLLDRIEGRAMSCQDGAAVLDAILIHQNIEIIPDRFRELGLGIE